MKGVASERFKCEFPFTGEYTIVKHYERRRAVIYSVRKVITTMYYSRYLMCVAYQRVLDSNECVHHIDEDKTNDDINNLQVLSIGEHTNIHHPKLPEVNLTCPNCSKLFSIAAPSYLRRTKLGYTIYCSKNCSIEMRNTSSKGIPKRIPLMLGTRVSIKN